MKKILNFENVIKYIKFALVLLLIVFLSIICARAYKDIHLYLFIAITICSFSLCILESVRIFTVKDFTLQMVFFAFDSVFMFAISVMARTSLVAPVYCVVLTGFYMVLEKFKDKSILFGVSCGMYFVSYIIGWVVKNSIYSANAEFLEVFGGILFGLLAIIIDYIVVVFLMSFYRTNKELSAALKEADESKARLEKAYEQLTLTKVYEERNRIAKDIHDNAGHSMTTVIMQTEAAKLLIDENPAEAKNRIISANIQARNALDQMRESVHLLAGRVQARPLREELEEIIAQTIDGTDIKARSDMTDVNVSAQEYRFIVNSVKELLANGIRHGKATAFYVELKKSDNQICVLVSDNGTGVKDEIKEGFGLRGIREKAEELGGSCSFSSEDGEGFEAEIYLPEKKDKKELK